MRTRYIAALALPMLLAGCAATPSTPPPVYPNLTGNWVLEQKLVPPATPVASILAFSGTLQSSGNSVTGILHAIRSPGAPCVSFHADLAVTGTIDPSGALSLTIPLPNGNALLTANLSPDLHSFSNGTVQISGDCATPSTPMILAQIAPLGASYTGTLTRAVGSLPGSPATIDVVASLTQSLTPDLDGLFRFSGSAIISGGCTQTVSFQTEALLGDAILPAPFSNFPLAPTLIPVTGVLLGGIDPTAVTMHASLSVPGILGVPPVSANCGGFYSGTLTRQ